MTRALISQAGLPQSASGLGSGEISTSTIEYGLKACDAVDTAVGAMEQSKASAEVSRLPLVIGT